MNQHKAIEFIALSIVAYLVYDTIIKPAPTTFVAGSTGTPNAIAVPTPPVSASVSSGSSVLSQTQTGNSLYEASGLGNNPVPVPTHELMGPDLF